MTPILPGRLFGIGDEDCATMSTRFGKDRDDFVYLFDRYQVPVGPLVTGLATGIALLGFHGRPSLGLGRRSIG
jgi:hypothetical protein